MARSTERAEASDTSCSAGWPPKMRASRILRSGADCSATCGGRSWELQVRVRRDDLVLGGVGGRGLPLLVGRRTLLLAQRVHLRLAEVERAMLRDLDDVPAVLAVHDAHLARLHGQERVE